MAKKSVIVVPVNQEPRIGNQLFRYFLAAAVIDNGGSLSISRRAMSELLRVYEDPDSFRIIVEPAKDDQDLTIKLLPLQ